MSYQSFNGALKFLDNFRKSRPDLVPLSIPLPKWWEFWKKPISLQELVVRDLISPQEADEIYLANCQIMLGPSLTLEDFCSRTAAGAGSAKE